jgi:hypothetical protein
MPEAGIMRGLYARRSAGGSATMPHTLDCTGVRFWRHAAWKGFPAMYIGGGVLLLIIIIILLFILF